MISRHFIDVANPDGGLRRVHYRTCGSGPPLLMVHQSPRSSAEYADLMQRWAADFTCIAPDTPGFGDSRALPLATPECEDYADAVIAFLDALGIAKTHAYGFHSGAIILVTAARHHPERFTALACGGYAVWTDAERADFGARYTPAFLPLGYGEHLAWLWGRLLEQSWFFPWYRTEEAARLGMAHADPARVHPIVMEVLAAGDSFSKGYAAVLRANRDVPPPGAPTVPVWISAYDGDPLKAHLARLGELPASWRVEPVATPVALEAGARAWLLRHPADPASLAAGAGDEGFISVCAGGFSGQLHWRGDRDSKSLFLHAPGSAVSAAPDGCFALDLPGHGLSDPWPDASRHLADWAAVVQAALPQPPEMVIGEGWGAMLAEQLGAKPAARPAGDLAAWRAQGLADLTPDRDGLYLLRAWRQVRAEAFFAPWFMVSAATARPFAAADASPEELALRHLALLRAQAARPYLNACLDAAA